MLQKLYKLGTLLDKLGMYEYTDVIDKTLETLATVNLEEEEEEYYEPDSFLTSEFDSPEIDNILSYMSAGELADILLDAKDQDELQELIGNLQGSFESNV